MKKMIIAISIASLVVAGVGCAPTKVIEETKVMLTKNGKYLPGEKLYVALPSTVNGNTASFNITTSAECGTYSVSVKSRSQNEISFVDTLAGCFSDYCQLKTIDGIVVVDSFAIKKIILLVPDTGISLKVGNVVAVKWKATNQISTVQVRLLVGRSYAIISSGSIAPSSSSWANFAWTIPDSIVLSNGTVATFGSTPKLCVFRIEDYSDNTVGDQMIGNVSITK